MNGGAGVNPILYGVECAALTSVVVTTFSSPDPKTRPDLRLRLEILEDRSLPGDALGGFLVAGLAAGLLPSSDPLARAESALASVGYSSGADNLSIVPQSSDSTPPSLLADNNGLTVSADSSSGASDAVWVAAGQGPTITPDSAAQPFAATPWGADPVADDALAQMLRFWDTSADASAGHTSAPSGGAAVSAGSSQGAIQPLLFSASNSSTPTPSYSSGGSGGSEQSGGTGSSGGSNESAGSGGSGGISGSGTSFSATEGGLESGYGPSGGKGVNPILRGVEGVALSGVVVTTFAAVGPNAVVGDFIANINWGDGASSGGSVAALDGGGFVVTGSHTYSDEGTYAAATTITDVELGSTWTATGNTQVIVAEAAMTASAVDYTAAAGTNAGVTVARFSDGGPSSTAADFHANIAWGDGSSSIGTVAAASGGGFVVTGSHAYAQAGRYQAAVAIADNSGSSPGTSGGQTVVDTATVTDPTFAAGTVTATAAGEGGDSLLVARFSDGLGAPASAFQATVDWGDGDSQGASIASGGSGGSGGSSYQISADHTYLSTGTYTVTVTFTDAAGDVVTETGTMTISDAPLTATGATAYAGAGTSADLVVAMFTDADPNADGSSYTATIAWGDGTSGAGVIAASSGVFAVSGTHTYAATETYAPTVSIHDVSSTATATGSVVVSTVNATAQPFGASKAVSSNVTVATFTDSGTGPDTAVIDWGDGTTPSVGVVSSVGGIYTVSGSHTYTATGVYVATATITTVDEEISVVAVPATVTDGTLSASGASVSAAQGVDTGGVVVAMFTATDPNATASDFGATIDWGDGSSPSLFNQITQSGSTFSVIGDYTYLTKGTFAVGVTITDGGATAAATGSATVGAGPINATAASINATEGAALSSITVATFTGDASAASIDWGDGITTEGAISGGAAYGSHTYAEAGGYTIKVTLSDANGYAIPVAGTADVADASLTAGGVSVTGAVEAQGFSGTVATFSDANPNATAADFTATIDWGDGVVRDGTVSGGNGAYTVHSDQTYFAVGSFPVAVNVTDADGASAAMSGTVVVSDSGLSGAFALPYYLGATQDLPVSGAPLATFTDSYTAGSASDYTANIDWGDGATSTGVVEGSDGRYGVRGSHTYTQAGYYTVQVKLSDAGGSYTAIGTANVAATPVYTVGNLSASGGSSSDYTATINWGDETEATDAMIVPNSSGGFAVTGKHAYAEEGSYGVSVTVTQAGGATATLVSTALVAATAVMAADAPQTPAAAPTATLKEVDFTKDSLYITNDFGDFGEKLARKWTAGKVVTEGPLAGWDGNSAIAYVGGKQYAITAKINVSNPDDYAGKTVDVIGDPSVVGDPNQADFPPITGTATLKDGVLVADQEMWTLPSKVEAWDAYSITWYVIPPDQPHYDTHKKIADQNGKWLDAGVSKDTLYVTYAKQVPKAPLYWTSLDVGCRAAAGKTTSDDIEQAVIDAFDKLEVRQAGLFLPGRVLTYWDVWGQQQPGDPLPSSRRQITTALLQGGDGNCDAWTNLFLDVLGVQGIGGQIVKVTPFQNNEQMFIQGWTVNPNAAKQAITMGKVTYQYVNTLNPGQPLIVKNANGLWGYQWNTADVTFDANPANHLKGQGEAASGQPPEAFFSEHVVARITFNGRPAFFDPSYGRFIQPSSPVDPTKIKQDQDKLDIHQLVCMFDDKIVIPFYVHVNKDPQTQKFVYEIRLNPGPTDDDKKPGVDTPSDFNLKFTFTSYP